MLARTLRALASSASQQLGQCSSAGVGPAGAARLFAVAPSSSQAQGSKSKAARYAAATPESSATNIPSEEDLAKKDVYTILAEMMHRDATKNKKQDALKNDLTKIINLVEKDTSGDPEADMEGRLKDILPRMGRQARNDFFEGYLESEDMKKAQPALKEVVSQLQSVGETSRIVEVAYRYMELLNSKGTKGAATVPITMTLAKQENSQDVEAKKSMLVEDMRNKGTLAKDQKVTWTVNVDPSIKGGVVYTIGDLLVDASVRSLQAQFFQSLDQAGLKKVA